LRGQVPASAGALGDAVAVGDANDEPCNEAVGDADASAAGAVLLLKAIQPPAPSATAATTTSATGTGRSGFRRIILRIGLAPVCGACHHWIMKARAASGTVVTPAANAHAPLAAFLSFLFPGLGQAYNGQSGLAWLLATPVFFVVAGIAIGIAGSIALSRLLDVRFLLGLVVLDAAILGWRLVAILQAHARLEPLSPRRWTSGVTAMIVLVTLGMHALPGLYALKAIDTLNSVSLGGGGGTTVGRIPGFSDLPVPSAQPDVGSGERVNILLVGIDALPRRTTQLTDTMLVVSLDPLGHRSAMISIPRDLYGVPLPNGKPYNAKLNSLMAVANADPTDYPMGGVGTLKATIGRLLGVQIHYFAAINLLGFKGAVDAIGGVDITVHRAIHDPTYSDEFGHKVGFDIEPGRYHMDGRTALAFVRSRKGTGDSDFTRADRQQQLLTALRAKLTARNLLLALPGLLDAVKDAVATDVPRDRLPQLAEAVQNADMSQLQRIVLQPPKYMSVDAHSAAGYILIPNLDAIRAVGEALLAEASPSPSAATTP
jgi:polyisoprenyl-teichoic acid--peptidoglycan teichoic acid transferase